VSGVLQVAPKKATRRKYLTKHPPFPGPSSVHSSANSFPCLTSTRPRAHSPSFTANLSLTSPHKSFQITVIPPSPQPLQSAPPFPCIQCIPWSIFKSDPSPSAFAPSIPAASGQSSFSAPSASPPLCGKLERPYHFQHPGDDPTSVPAVVQLPSPQPPAIPLPIHSFAYS
jgi:hypothetical protein